MTSELRKTDIVIIGLGAAGGMAVLPLTQAGFEVVGIEAGPWLSTRDFPLDDLAGGHPRNRKWFNKVRHEIPTWRRSSSPLDGGATDPPSRLEVELSARVRSQPGASFGPQGRMMTLGPAVMMNAVGGSSIHYGAASYRLTPWEFKVRSETIARYGASAIPAGSTIADWPISYGDLEPYYDKVEYAIGISGQAGNVQGVIDPRGNPFEGSRSRPYPMPALRSTGYLDLMADAARSLAWHPFPTPAAINSEPYRGRPGCSYCSFCTGNGCHNDAKSSTLVTSIREAQQTGRLTVLANARAIRIEVDDESRVTGVTFTKGGAERFQPARMVLLAGYVYENSRLLLHSKSKAYPHGLANNHGQVGKHYSSHTYPRTHAVFSGRRLNVIYGAGGQGINVDDWNNDNFDHTGLGFVGGGKLQAFVVTKPIALAEMKPPNVPHWGSRWKAWVHENANSATSVHSNLETLTYEDSFLDLDPAVTDQLGIPVVRVTFDLHENEHRLGAFLLEKQRQWLLQAGATAT